MSEESVRASNDEKITLDTAMLMLLSVASI